MATPPPTAPQIIIQTPPTPQTTLELETQTPPPPPLQSNPPSQPLLAVPVAPTEDLASMPLTFAVIQAYYRRFRRFVCMEVLKSLIGFGVGVLVTYLWMKNKK